MLISKKENILIVGAGLSGLSCAYHLKDNYTILEKEKTVGGLCRTLPWKGFNFDFSGHLLHLHNKEIKSLVAGMLKNNINEHYRQAFVYYKGKYVPFPFQANLFGLPIDVVKDCLYGLISAQCNKHKKKATNFKEWINNYFGSGFAKHFFIPYNTKLFGVELEEMTSEWCEWFIPKPKINQIVSGAFEYQVADFGYNSKFYYPKTGGIQALPNAFAQRIRNLHLNSNVGRIFWKEKRVELNSKLLIEYEQLISTMPIPELLKNLEPFPEELNDIKNSFRWRSVQCLNIGIRKRDAINRHWIYFPEPEFIFHRVGFIHNISRSSVPEDCAAFYIEIATNPNEKANLNRLFSKAIMDLNRLNIIAKDDKIIALQHMPMQYAYVIHDNKREKALKRVKEFLNKNSIHSIGRYGDWKYSFMEEAILDGQKLAAKLHSRK
ncbi:MAG: FAD-dependent oxidoreductase [bacterium]